MKILIAYDGSECSNAALRDLQRAGLPDEAEALILAVAEDEAASPLPSGVAAGAGSTGHMPTAGEGKARLRFGRAVEETRTAAADACERIKAQFPLWKAQGLVAYGSPAREIITKAKIWRPDLIVVGSHGRSAIGRFILGSVSQKILAETRTAVRVARGDEKPQGSPVRLIIGLDGSASSDLAVEVVAARSWPAGSEVRLMTSVEPFHMYGVEPEVQMSRVRTLHAMAEIRLREAGLPCSSVITEGNPKTALLDEAEAWGADSIFIGARGLKGINRLLLGSVSAAVAARARCSVEIVRSPHEAMKLKFKEQSRA